MSDLGDKQRIFTLNIGYLIIFAYTKGYELTEGDAFRSERAAIDLADEDKGIVNSLHTRRLAHDFNLFRNKVYLTNSSAYQPLGDYWKSLHPLNRWGGDFKPVPDGNHFSMEDGGIK